MAVNFGLLNTADLGEQFRAGMRDADNALARRQEQQIRAQQVAGLAEERQALAEQRRAKTQADAAEADARRQRQEKLTQLLTQNGHRPSRELYATMAQDPDARVQAIAFQALKDLDADEAYRSALQPQGTAADGFSVPSAQAQINQLLPLARDPRAQATINTLQRQIEGQQKDEDRRRDDERQRATAAQAAADRVEARALRQTIAAQRGSRSSGAGSADLVGEVGKGVVEIVDRDTGEKRLVSRAEAVRLGAMSAKEANIDAKTEAKADKEQKARNDTVELINSLQTDYDELDRLGGMVNNQRGAISNLAARVASSGPGQLAGGAIGSKEQTQRDKINNTRLRLLNAIKNAEGTGVGSLNSNMELQTYLAALGDVTQSKQTIDETLRKIKTLVDRAAASAPAVAPGAAPAAPGKGRDIGGGFKLVD